MQKLEKHLEESEVNSEKREMEMKIKLQKTPADSRLPWAGY
jgi:hypothetical protein